MKPWQPVVIFLVAYKPTIAFTDSDNSRVTVCDCDLLHSAQPLSFRANS